MGRKNLHVSISYSTMYVLVSCFAPIRYHHTIIFTQLRLLRTRAGAAHLRDGGLRLQPRVSLCGVSVRQRLRSAQRQSVRVRQQLLQPAPAVVPHLECVQTRYVLSLHDAHSCYCYELRIMSVVYMYTTYTMYTTCTQAATCTVPTPSSRRTSRPPAPGTERT